MNVIKPVHRDLLGGSNTDLSNLGDQPLKPAEKVDENYIEYCDPFDTVIYTAEPGQTELKYLERELLSDIKKEKSTDSLSDEDFDPRAFEDKARERTQSRPDVLNISATKTVSFDLPSPKDDLLSGCSEESTSKISKPLTPYYDRKNSIPEIPLEESVEDPFDTSFVANVAPGKAELKIIESDLFNSDSELLDPHFDPRDEKQVAIAEVVQTIKEIYNPIKQVSKTLPLEEIPKPVDLLTVENEVEGKVLTPAKEEFQNPCVSFSSADPFDTSIANNILPGRTELKLLETELITSGDTHKHSKDISNKSAETKQDLLIHSADTVIDKPLSPVTNLTVNCSVDEADDDFDPFDTSIANNIAPGRTELRLLESELI